MRRKEVNQQGTRPRGSADEKSVLPASPPVVQAEAGAALHDESSPARRGDPARGRRKDVASVAADHWCD